MLIHVIGVHHYICYFYTKATCIVTLKSKDAELKIL